MSSGVWGGCGLSANVVDSSSMVRSLSGVRHSATVAGHLVAVPVAPVRDGCGHSPISNTTTEHGPPNAVASTDVRGRVHGNSNTDERKLV
jgi:hypothetical protein